MPQAPIQAKVTKEDAKGFAKVWNHNDIVIVFDEHDLQFATDFANVVLQNFIQQAQARAAEAAKPKVVIGDN